MDPLTVVGLVSNIVQLADAASKAAIAIHEIYKEGALTGDNQLRSTTEHLQRTYSSLQPTTSGTTSQPLSSGIDLSVFSSQYCSTAKVLLDELHDLQNNGGRRRDAILKYIKRLRKAKEIEDVKARLEHYQKVLDSQVLADVRHIITETIPQQRDQGQKLEQQLAKLSADLASCPTVVSSHWRGEFDKAIEQLIQSNKQEHATTRQHFQTHLDAGLEELRISQQQRESTRAGTDRMQQQRDQILKSLRFDDVHLRENNVADRYSKTFEWVFDDNVEKPWDSFGSWLKGQQPLFWVRGKAGSGKSTLMKFLVNDDRTKSALAAWSQADNAIILTFYFWLSGSELQRSMKGLLCSLFHQLLSRIDRLLEDLIATNIVRDNYLLTRRTVADWDEAHLQELLLLALEKGGRPVCIFLDGLDEFDQEDDVEKLLCLVEDVSKFAHVKVCLSSRPEKYLSHRLQSVPKLRLQDLTDKDIRLCAREELESVRTKCTFTSVHEDEFQVVIDMVTRKAEGVFLWVHYALRSLAKGMRNGDTFEILVQRIESLPSKMELLYSQMWDRLNDDKDLYLPEARRYFSYHEHFPMSTFELMVALDSDLQERYIDSVAPQDPAELLFKCEILHKQLLTRCAGLLEIDGYSDDTIGYNEDAFVPPTGSSNLSQSEPELPPEPSSKPGLDEEHSHSELGSEVPSGNSNSLDLGEGYLHCASSQAQMTEESLQMDLGLWGGRNVKFFHRTARDFILNTGRGRDLISKQNNSRDERIASVAKARLASWIQSPAGGNVEWIADALHIVLVSANASETWDLVTLIQRIAEHVSAGAPPENNIRCIGFWYSGIEDILGMIAQTAPTFIRYVLENKVKNASSYYQGYLVRTLSENVPGVDFKQTIWPVITWLIHNGADVFTDQAAWSQDWRSSPAVRKSPCLSVLEAILDRTKESRPGDWEEVLPFLIDRPKTVRIKIHKRSNWYWVRRWEYFVSECWHVEVSFSKLLRAEMRRHQVEQVMHLSERFDDDQPTRIVFHETVRDECGKCMSYDDSIYLGEALERYWTETDPRRVSSDDDAVKELEVRVEKVLQRSSEIDYEAWQVKTGQRFERDPATPVIDPFEEIDASNWVTRRHISLEGVTDELALQRLRKGVE